MKYRRYTAAEDDALRDAWPNASALAKQLDRDNVSVRNRAIKLGLPVEPGKSKNPFTDAERQMVIDRYPAEGAKPLAREMGRKQADLVSVAQRLGVTCRLVRRWSAEDDARLSEMYRGGKKYGEIALAIDRSPTAVSKRAESLGLVVPWCDWEERHRRMVNLRPLSNSVCEIRWARQRLALGEHGWPPDLNPKEVSILESLRTRGPQTRLNLSASIGEPPTRPLRKRLMGHAGRSAMGRLLERGLVARCFINEERKRAAIYTLTQYATEHRGTFQSVASFNEPIAARKRLKFGSWNLLPLEKAS